MDANDLTDLFITALDKIEFYWNFYVVMLIALIGWLVSAKTPLSVRLKALITVGYLVFVAMNILGLYSSYTFAEAIRMDLLALEGLQNLENTRSVLRDQSYMQQRQAVFWIHLIVGAAVLATVWLQRGRGRDA